ncbi:4'-phosphopantetheinyl transferase family protein [Streptomyces iconiensis]|uniref:4'-phosphopantetheinyl transferase n=1 Tax=Streptomyces iconiensis TaxID=1384038 RepID=A0ABT6ZVZ7_9ACTN|nr:hypothetical protein [Streptomyces iconiensis]MDJ1133002.1 hypothetical protein [Streptomyces iconiensis]
MSATTYAAAVPGIHVWAVDLRPSLATCERLSVLSAEEQERFSRYRLHRPAYEFGLTRAALRHITGRRLGMEAETVPLDSTCGSCGHPHGRPRVPGLSVSVSRTRGKALIALAPSGTPVGVDVEVLAPCLPGVSETAGTHRPTWVRKEAYAKACDLAPAPGQVRLLPFHRAVATGNPSLHMTELDLPGNQYDTWVAALAASSTDEPHVRKWYWRPASTG